MIERRTANGGMDNDSAPEFVQKDDYLVAHNCRVQKNRDGMAGAAKPLASTIGRTAATVETTSVIGAINDDPNQRVFFFRWSFTNDHRIICWNRRTNTALTVLKQADVVDGLGFGQFSYITGVAMIGDYLYWCDGVTNQPRRIDVERALKTNNPTYISPDGTNPAPYAFPLNQWDISIAMRMPLIPINFTKINSFDDPNVVDRDNNFITGNSFQFSYRFKYKSFEYSTIAPYSKLAPHNRRKTTSSFNFLDERYDTILVEMPKEEAVMPEVQAIEFLVRRGNIGSWYILKIFDRRDSNVVMEAHNDPLLPSLGFYFYNDRAGIPLSDSEAYIPFYDVPLFSNSLEIANNRLFLFNNIRGYDWASGIDIVTELVTEPLDLVNTIPQDFAFKWDSVYQLGIIFYDYAGRNAGVMPKLADINIPERAWNPPDYISGVRWTLPSGPQSAIPLGAMYYSVVRTKNLSYSEFISGLSGFGLNEVKYGNREVDGTFLFDSNTYAGNSYIGIPLNNFVLLGTGYSYSEGDVVKLIKQGTNEVFKMRVVGTQGDVLVASAIDIGDTSTEIYYVQIYQPNNLVEAETLYEVGDVFKISNPGLSTRSFSIVSSVMVGDIFLGSQTAVQSVVIEMQNKDRDFPFQWDTNIGRASRVSYSKQQRYETDLHPSGPFFPGTEINQLNAFLSGENKQLDLNIGFGQRLVLASRTQEYGTVMLAIGKTEVASIYLGRTEFFNADETPNVLRSTDIIGTVNILKGGFGTLNPESCFKNDGDIYWFSAIKSAFVRYAKDGVNPISDRKMSSFAAWLGNAVLTSASDIPGQPGIKVVGGFDDYHKEALWAVPPIGNWPIAFNTLDAVVEELAITEPTPGNMSAAIVPGEIYRFSMSFIAPVTANVTVWDYHFGQRTFVATSANPSFMFVGRPGAPTTITVMTTPPIATTLHSSKLERLRPYPYSAIDRVPKTIAFSESNGRWSHTSSHTPEWFSRIGDQLVTFRGGVLFTHDATTVGNFYGVQYPAWISFAFNEQPNTVKRLQGVSLESNAKPSYIHFRTEEPFVQSSDLLAADIETEEGIFSSSVLRDRLSPNTPGTVEDKLYRGDEMRGRYAKVLLEWAKGSIFATRIINLITRPSSGHKT